LFKQFVRLEIMESFTGARFIIVFVMSSLLILSSIFSGYLKYDEARRWQSAAVAANKSALEDQGSWRKMKNLGSKATRAPNRLSVLIRGIDGAVGKSAYATPSAQLVLRDSRDELNPIYALLNELDLGFIIRVVLSLFAMLFSFNAISGEREQGTLKMIVSNSVNRFSILIGKLLGNLLVISLSLVIPALIGLLIVELAFGVSFTGEEWARILLILVNGIVYLMLFYCIGLLVSAVTRRSIVSFTICLLVWVVVVAIVPNMAVEASRVSTEMRTMEQLEREVAQLRHERWKNEINLLEAYVNPELERQKGGTYDSDKLSEFSRKARQEALQSYQDKEKALIREYQRELKNRTDVGLTYALISPTSCFNIASMQLAGTDAELRFRFTDMLEEYRRQFQEYADEKIAAAEDYVPSRVSWNLDIWTDDETGETKYKYEAFGPTEKLSVDDAPVFTFAENSLANVTAESLPLTALIAIQALLIFLLATVFFNRYDPR